MKRNPRNPAEDFGRRSLSYLGEFRSHWPNVLGAWLGIAVGIGLNHYMVNLIGPSLIQEFGWPKWQFALYGTVSLGGLIFIPLAGACVDRFGPRISGMIGFVALPLCLLAYTFMDGSIVQFLAITLLLNAFGSLTTALVFARVIVDRFELARGMALGIAMSGTSLVSAIVGPFIGEINSNYGWRAGYWTLALISALGGFCAIQLIGCGDEKGTVARHRTRRKITLQEFLAFARDKKFILLVGGMFLVNLPQIIIASQLGVVLLENGASSTLVVLGLSVFAISVFLGRFLSGFLLDRFRPNILAATFLSLPALGFLLLMWASGAVWALLIAVTLVGLAQGGEGDFGAFLTSKMFALQHYSFIYSFLIVSIALASAVGSLVLSMILRITQSFDMFLWLCVLSTLLGAYCFWATGKYLDRSTPSGEAPGLDHAATHL